MNKIKLCLRKNIKYLDMKITLGFIGFENKKLSSFIKIFFKVSTFIPFTNS